ncbi:MAG: O-antigen ligase family protein, partial [Bdellovibrionales bacterium]
FLPEYFARLGIDQEFVSHAHNNLLQFLGGTGIFGFISYCAVIFIFLRKAWRIRKVTAWGWSLFLAQLYMQLGGLTEANFIDGEVNHMLIFTWAILLVVEAKVLKSGKLASQH